MNQVIQNELIESARVGFFDEGLNRGTYGLTIKLRGDAPKAPLSPKVFSAVKQLVEEPLPGAGKRARVLIPDNFRAQDSLRWLLAALKRFGIAPQAVFGPQLGESTALSEAAWRIMRTSEPMSFFLDFDELWYEPTSETPIAEFPLWPLPHAVYLYLRGQNREVSEVVQFMQLSKFPWSLL